MTKAAIVSVVLLIAAAPFGAHAAGGSYGGSGSYGSSPTEPRERKTDMQKADERLGRANYKGAVKYLKRRLKEAPEDADAWNLMGFAHRKMKDYEAAEDYYGRALELNPHHKGALEYRGELYLETDRPEEARAALRALETLCPAGCSELDDMRAAFARMGVAEIGG